MSSVCPICQAGLARTEPANTRATPVDCPRCGRYQISWAAESALGEYKNRSPNFWAVASHAIRRRSDRSAAGALNIDSNWLRQVAENETLPTPARQAENLIEFLGSKATAPPYWVWVRNEALGGIVGNADPPLTDLGKGLTYVLDHLRQRGLVEFGDLRAPPYSFRLTFGGWDQFEANRREVQESRRAFMAMGYGATDAAEAFRRFKEAVSLTGFELKRSDEAPKAGLIDLRMRVEIRTAKFVIADLTDDNRGAYWEGGFAEGVGKKVYYTCEADKFEKLKTHFDTEHLLTIKWKLANMEMAIDELKAVIRNDFYIDAILEDQPNR